MNIPSRAVSLVFPLTLAILMGGVTFWLNRATDVNIESVLLNPSQPQYVMSAIDGVRFDEHGQIAQTLQADSAKMFPNSTDVLVANPKGYMYADGKELYHVVSSTARYSDKQKKIFFEKEVLFTKAMTNEAPAGRVKTSQMEIDIPTQVAKTTQEVAYEYGVSKGTATGFSYDKKNEVLHLDSRVKAIIYDQP